MESWWNCYVVKLVLVEIGYVVLTSTNFALYDFFKIPKIVLSEDPCIALMNPPEKKLEKTYLCTMWLDLSPKDI